VGRWEGTREGGRGRLELAREGGKGKMGVHT
jgi:hypothetical protein